MSEFIRNYVSDLQPGDVVEFDNLTYKTDLTEFEDMIATIIAPVRTEGEELAWNHREKLHEIIRPRGNNGTISNVRVMVMDNAYEQLTQASHRGLTLMKGVTMKHVHDASEHRKHEYIGFDLIADIKRYGKEPEQIYKELHYLPWDWGKNPKRLPTKHNPYVRRIHAEPLDTQERIDFKQQSAVIGFMALKNS